jgi:hypothetical protein
MAVSCIKGERVIKCLGVDFDTHRLVHNRSDQGLSLLDIRMALRECNSAGPEGHTGRHSGRGLVEGAQRRDRPYTDPGRPSGHRSARQDGQG